MVINVVVAPIYIGRYIGAFSGHPMVVGSNAIGIIFVLSVIEAIIRCVVVVGRASAGLVLIGRAIGYISRNDMVNIFGRSTYFFRRINMYILQVIRATVVKPKSSIVLINVKMVTRSSSYRGL